jgi:polysaccharide pyruvyl transferase CsaB
VKERPRILICGWAGAGNVGDELLTRSIAQMVIEAGGQPVVASRHPLATEALHDGVEAVPWGIRTLWAGRSCAGVVVGPGGIIQDSSSIWSLPGHLLGPIVHRWRGMRVTGIGLGAEPLRRRSSRWMVRRALGGVAPIVRDDESAAAMALAGVDAVVAPDIAFALAPVVGPQPAREEIVVSVGGAVAPGSFLPAAKRMVTDDPAEVAASLDTIAERMGLSVAFVSFRGQRDTDFARLVESEMVTPSRLIVPSLDDSVVAVARARVVVSSRYHAALVAVQSGVPCVVISDQAKLRSLVRQVADVDRIQLVNGWGSLAAIEPAQAVTPYVPIGVDLLLTQVRDLVTRCSDST